MTDAEIRDRLRGRLQAVEERIADSCRRAGRSRSDVTLIAVTKGVDDRIVAVLPELGIFDLGESRPQELGRKAKALENLPIRWHMIGHLQRNKVGSTLPLANIIHAVDSPRLLEELEKEAKKRGIVAIALLEVNASREPNKYGYSPEAIPEAIASLERYPHIRIEGLMTLAAYSENPQLTRPTFAELRQLRDRMGLKHLSMGMSNDFEVAIEEGATLIRLGTVLFEGLEAIGAA